MKYPDMKYVDRYRSSTQVKFGGLNMAEGAEDGEICHMRNMTADFCPVLATRQRRYRIAALKAPGGLVALEKLGWVDGGEFVYDGKVRGAVSPGQKVFGVIGTTIIILPDKCWYDTATDTFGQMESKWEGNNLTFTNGLTYFTVSKRNFIKFCLLSQIMTFISPHCN